MSFIILEQHRIPFADIPDIIDRTHFTGYSKAILDFCTAWLRNQPSFHISTSGSTGTPQPIIWSRELMLWSINNTARAIHLERGMHCLLCIDASKAGGMMMLARALQLNMSIEVVVPSSNPLINCSATHFDFASMVPLQIHALHSGNIFFDLNNIDTLLIGGATLSLSLTMALQAVNTKVFATYGMTETASHIAIQQINGNERQDGFMSLPEVQITTDEENCAVITTPFHVALTTNDIIKLHSDGSFNVLGRRGNVVNSGGYKIALEPIEAAMDEALTALKIDYFNFCAWKKPDEKLGEALIFIFETNPMDESSLAALQLELAERLPKYEVAKHFYFTERLAYTSSGKIDRKGSAEKIGI